jgi:hypothetical protein
MGGSEEASASREILEKISGLLLPDKILILQAHIISVLGIISFNSFMLHSTVYTIHFISLIL